jgi:RNA polymerase sigma-70 factor, ECF subfamily
VHEKRTSRRERTAFAAEVGRSLAALYGFARTLTDPAEAEDLVQTACLRAFESYGRFVPRATFRAWIFTILKNEFVSRHRRERRWVELRADAAIPLPGATGAEDLEAMLIEQQWHAEVRDALIGLPEAYRAPVYLKDVAGFAYREIAEIEGCPVGTVMSRLSRGRALLRRALGALARERGLFAAAPARRIAR